MESLTLPLSAQSNRVLNQDGRSILRQLNFVQGETYSITLAPTGSESLSGISNFTFSLRQNYDSENLIEINSITSGVFTLPLDSITLNNALAGHDYRYFRAYLSYSGSEAEIFHPFVARIESSDTGVALRGYVSSVNGQTGDVTVTAGGTAQGAVMTTGNQSISGQKDFNGIVRIRHDGNTVFEKDSAGFIYINDPNGNLRYSSDSNLWYSASAPALDFNNWQLFDNEETTTLDWNNRSLIGQWTKSTAPTGVSDIVNKGYADTSFVGVTGNQTVSGDKLFAGILKGQSGFYGPFGTNPYIHLTAQQIIDSNGILAFDWYSRNLYGSSQSEGIDLANGVAYYGDAYLSWGPTFGVMLSDSDGFMSVDASNRNLFDAAVNLSVAFDTRRLYDSSVITAVDYSNRILSGNWQCNVTPTLTGHLINKKHFDANAVQLTGFQTILGNKNFHGDTTFYGGLNATDSLLRTIIDVDAAAGTFALNHPGTSVVYLSNDGTFKDAVGGTCANVPSRLLTNSSSQTTVDWANYKLCAAGAVDALNWNTRTLTGRWQADHSTGISISQIYSPTNQTRFRVTGANQNPAIILNGRGGSAEEYTAWITVSNNNLRLGSIVELLDSTTVGGGNYTARWNAAGGHELQLYGTSTPQIYLAPQGNSYFQSGRLIAVGHTTPTANVDISGTAKLNSNHLLPYVSGSATAPSNTGTPARWLDVVVTGVTYKLPLYL